MDSNNDPPAKRGDFNFGHSPNITGNAQVRFELACQPCIGLLTTRKRVAQIVIYLADRFLYLPLAGSLCTPLWLLCSFLPYLHNPLHQNSLFRYANFIFPNFWNIINLSFPFRYTINPDTLILGGILTSKWM